MNELPKDRLTTTDETGKRLFVYPQAIKGFWHTRRTWVYWFLIVLFLAVPFIKINGHPMLLLDVIHRRFSVMGIQFLATDVPMVVLIFLLFVIGIALITSILGRAWCGWSCPQTVFIDVIYRKIDEWVEGDSFARKKLDAGPLTFDKAAKKTIKWTAFISISWIISHSFLAYFVGSSEVFKYIQQSPSENWGTFQAVCFMTAIVAFDFGWFREQFCTIMCPYGRLQSVLMDEHSLIVQYDKTRNDCIECGKCVRVCPTGIDIRRGLQMECIGCTACIDACDEIMVKVNQPTGLIRFDTENGLKNRKIGRVRTYLYAAVLVILLGTLVTVVTLRKSVEFTLLRAHDDPYRTLEGDSSKILNHFKLKMHNREFKPVKVTFTTSDNRIKISTPIENLILNDSQERDFDFFVTFPKEILNEGRAKSSILLHTERADKSIENQDEEVMLIGPF